MQEVLQTDSTSPIQEKSDQEVAAPPVRKRVRKRRRKIKNRLSIRNVNFTLFVTLGFILVSIATVVITVYALSVNWGQIFSIYTDKNLSNLAQGAANRIAGEAVQNGTLTTDAMARAVSEAGITENVRVRVVTSNGETIYDTSGDESESPMGGGAAGQVYMANVFIGGSTSGTIQLWVVNNADYVTKNDLQFRDQVYRTLGYAAIIAFVCAILFGILFGYFVAKPIKRIAFAARQISDGRFDARSGVEGTGEIGQLGSDFDAMADSIERDRKLERQLTSDVAHELRTPLMAIQSTVEAMIDGVYEPDEIRLIEVDQEVQRLSRLVGALLRLSRLETRSQPMNEEVIDLGELVEGIVISHEILVQDSGLTIQCFVVDPVKVLGDPDMIRQAVANLISNAVRYTSEGGQIVVAVRRQGYMAAIDVSDTGIGLSPEEEKKVFTRFWRSDAGRARADGGLGVGLAVVREIADRHKGSVLAKGQKGVGSTFTILIPLYDEDLARAQARSAVKAFERKQAESGSRHASTSEHSGGHSE